MNNNSMNCNCMINANKKNCKTISNSMNCNNSRSNCNCNNNNNMCNENMNSYIVNNTTNCNCNMDDNNMNNNFYNNRKNCNQNTKKDLWNIITETSFALDDIKLFLDTHPQDEEALKCYEDYKKIRTVAIMEYTREYGPISAYNVNSKNSWQWVCNPWPWEGEC